jgi:Isochorismatase family
MLHNWFIEPEQYLRHETRRGRRHGYEWLDPKRTALVVIDMVPFFVGDPDIGHYPRGIVPNIMTLAEGLRAAGGTVAWVLPSATEPSPATVELLGAKVAELYRTSGGGGPLRSRLWHEFEVADSDLLVEKSSASAFFPGRSELPTLLEARNIESVLITGTVANQPPVMRARLVTARSWWPMPTPLFVTKTSMQRCTPFTERSATYVQQRRFSNSSALAGH